jgi:hypothetical protein
MGFNWGLMSFELLSAAVSVVADSGVAVLVLSDELQEIKIPVTIRPLNLRHI